MTFLVENGHDISGITADKPTNVEDGQRFVNTQTGDYSVYRNGQWNTVGNGVGSRYQLDWVAGKRGKPSLNANILDASEAVRMIADTDFEVLGTGATSALSTFNEEGGITLTTGATDGNHMILAPHLDANQTAWTETTWGTDQSVQWSATFATGANITNAIIWAGLKLTNTNVVPTDDDQVFIRYEDDISAGVWTIGSSIADVDTTTVTTQTVAVSTLYNVVINIDSSRIATVYINGVLELTTAALTTAIDLIPYIAVELDGASAAKAITVRGQSISRDYA